MRTFFALTYLAVAVAPASADTFGRVCAADKPLVEIRYVQYFGPDGTRDVVTASFTVFVGGSIRGVRNELVHPKKSLVRNVCAEERELASLKQAVDEASLKFVDSKQPCDAKSNGHVEWRVKGKLTWTDDVCHATKPDASTAKLVELVNALEIKYHADAP